jgi:hypothetical protein
MTDRRGACRNAQIALAAEADFDGEPYSLAVTGRFATFGKIAWIAAAKYAARLPLCIATR